MAVSKVVVKSVALPSEHGGWSFLLEPILLGLLVALSPAGLLLAIATIGVFLIHQPLKIMTKDRLKGRHPPRLVWAERFVIGYGLLALVPFSILCLTQPLDFLIPIFVAIPFASIQLLYDARNQSRHIVPEVCGAIALATSATSIALLAGWNIELAFVLWGILSLRAVTAILYVRARIRLEHGSSINPQVVWMVHLFALLVIFILALLNIAPLLTVVPFAILLMRAMVGLSSRRRPQAVKVIGMQELAYGLMTVFIVALGYAL